MKRSNYAAGGSGRGVPAQKAPLPFNLPSKKREAGYDANSGGIAAAGAKWASSHPSSVDASHNSPQQKSSNPGQSPPPPAWGGAGMRMRASPTRAEFPSLRNAPQQSLPAGASFVRTTPHPPSPPTISAPIYPSVAADHDWGEDDDGIDLAVPLALPEVLVMQPSALPPPVSPQHVGEPYATEEDVPVQVRGPLGSRNVTIQSRPRILHSPQQISMTDRQNIEQQKDRMKAKAESAHEAWRRAEEERVRGQRERAAEKLRALEMKLGAAATSETKTDENVWPRGAIKKKDEPPPPIIPKVLLRRPAQKEPPQKDVASVEVVAPGPTRTVKLEQRRRNRSSFSGETRQRGKDRDVKPYDGPLENETREHWLGRRRTMTETRDAVRNIIDICIHRAVYGYSRNDRRRGSSRKNSGRDRGGNRSHVAYSAMNSVTGFVTTSVISSQGVRFPHQDSNSNVSRRHRGSLMDERELTSYKTPKVAIEPAVGSSSSRTALSPQEVVAGDETDSLPKNGSGRGPRRAKKRGGKNSERGKRERRDTDVKHPPAIVDTTGDGDSSSATSLGRSHSNANSSDRNVRRHHVDRSRADNWRSSAWSNNSGPRVANGPPVDSLSTQVAGAGSDGVVGETTDSQRSGAGRGTAKRNKKRNGKSERVKRERQQHSVAPTSSAPPAPTAFKTVVFGPYVHKVLPSAGRGAGGCRDISDDASAWNNRPAQPTSFDDISRAFSNSKGLPLLGAPIIPAVPVPPFISAPGAAQGSAATKGTNSWTPTSTWSAIAPVPQVNTITMPGRAPDWTPFRGGGGDDEKHKSDTNSTQPAPVNSVRKDGASSKTDGVGGRRGGRNRRGRGKRNGGGRRKPSIQEANNAVNPKTEVKDPGAAPLESTGDDPVDVGSTSTGAVPSSANGQPRSQRNGGRGRGGDRRGSRSRFNGSRRKVRNRRPPPTQRSAETKTENLATQQPEEETVTKSSTVSP